MNIFDYIKWRGDLSFENDGVNEVDAAIFSRLSYLPLEDIVSGGFDKTITIEQAGKCFFEFGERKPLIWSDDADLLKAMAESRRFKNLSLSGFTDNIADNEQMQFAAVTIKINSDLHFIAFRGTDHSVTGWLEDFNMYSMFPLPSQSTAVEYLESAAKSYSGDFIIGGHSKGGNLSVYSASVCSPLTRNRIKSVYNLDGPGFDKRAMEETAYNDIKSMIHTLVPQSSVFGMMLEHHEKYTIIKSIQKGFYQHDVSTWALEGKSFVRLDDLTNTSRFCTNSLNDFVDHLSIDERKAFTKAVFDLLKSTNENNFDDMLNNWGKSSAAILKSIKSCDAKTRSIIISTIFTLIKSVVGNIPQLNPLSKDKHKSKK